MGGETIFDRTFPSRFPTCTDTCSFETGRNVRFGGGGLERNRCVRLELPGASRVMTRGVNTLLRFRWTMGGRRLDRNSTPCAGERGGIEEGDVLIRQNPILFIRSFARIAREIVRGLRMDCVWGIVATFPFQHLFRRKERKTKVETRGKSCRWMDRIWFIKILISHFKFIDQKLRESMTIRSSYIWIY